MHYLRSEDNIDATCDRRSRERSDSVSEDNTEEICSVRITNGCEFTNENQNKVITIICINWKISGKKNNCLRWRNDWQRHVRRPCK